jgi:hypothetical protein
MGKFFKCPHCNALYEIIKPEAGPETIAAREITCRVCAGPLPARDGKSILKYFLLREATRRVRKTSNAAN